MDRDFIEREYTNRALVPEHPQFFERWERDSAYVRSTLPGRLDLAYGPDARHRLDVFPAQASRGTVVFFHGGYWRSLDKSDFSWLAPPFVQHGVAVALLNYGLAPATPMEDMVRQQIGALAWLYRNGDRLGFDPERIVVAGHSAGAHLTAMLMAALFPVVASDLPARLIKGGLAISGISDLAPLVRAPFVNVDLRLDAARARVLSPAHLPPDTDAPLITAVGGLESSGFQRQTALIGRSWRNVFRRDVPMAGRNHLTVVDELANPASPLFDAALELVRDSNSCSRPRSRVGVGVRAPRRSARPLRSAAD
jgi:arylformamidase